MDGKWYSMYVPLNFHATTCPLCYIPTTTNVLPRHTPRCLGVTPSLDDLYRVGLVDAEGDCIVWNRKRHNGYGMLPPLAAMQMGEVRAHRVAVLLDGRIIPAGMNVLHSCDNPPCVNPAHLYVGTQTDNARDMRSRGRGRNQYPLGGIPAPERVCSVCGATYQKRSATCSRSCGARLTWVSAPVRNQRRRELRECLICDAEFETTPKASKRTCSRACGLRLNHQNRNTPLDLRPIPKRKTTR